MSPGLFIELLPDAVCIAICSIAAVIDSRTRRIPNWLSLPSTAIGLALNFALIWFDSDPSRGLRQGLLPSFVGCAVLFFVFIGLNAIGAMGMGDVKLMAAVGAFLRWPLAIFALAYVLLAGAILSIVYAVASGRMRGVLSNMKRGVKSLFGGKQEHEKIELHHMPYALSILIGVVWAVLSRYFEVFRLW